MGLTTLLISLASGAAPLQAQLDHVMLAVSDLGKARTTFEAHGFAVTKGGKFADGVENVALRFQDGTYLEIMAIADPKGSSAAEFETFLKTGPGSMGFGLQVPDAPKLLDVLKAKGEPVVLEVTSDYQRDGQPKSTGWQWKDVFWKDKGPVGDPFFVEYAKKREHSTAKSGIKAVLVAVNDLEKAKAQYSGLGFRFVKDTPRADLGAKQAEFALETGSILLVSPTSAGPVRAFLDRKGQGVFGVSLSKGIATNLSREISGLWIEER